MPHDANKLPEKDGLPRALRGAMLEFYPIDNRLRFRESHGNELRDAEMAALQTGFGIELLGFSIGFNRSVLLYPKTIRTWVYENRTEPVTEEERQRIVASTCSMLLNQGYRVRMSKS